MYASGQDLDLSGSRTALTADCERRAQNAPIKCIFRNSKWPIGNAPYAGAGSSELRLDAVWVITPCGSEIRALDVLRGGNLLDAVGERLLQPSRSRIGNRRMVGGLLNIPDNGLVPHIVGEASGVSGVAVLLSPDRKST